MNRGSKTFRTILFVLLGSSLLFLLNVSFGKKSNSERGTFTFKIPKVFATAGEGVVGVQGGGGCSEGW